MSGVHILGAGAIPWGKQPVITQLQMALEAINAALRDAELNWKDVDGVVAASSRFEGGMGWGLHANEIVQAASERGVPCINVGGACAAGAIAFQTAFSMIASGQSETVVVIGAERMPKGFIPRPPGGADDITDNDFLRWVTMGLTNPAYWAMEAQRRIYDYKTTHESLAEAVMLMRRNAVHNPNARFRKSVTAAEVLASPMVTDPLHLLQICPVSDGAAALILCSEKFAARAARKSVEVAGVGIASGTYGDPAAVPSKVWKVATRRVSSRTGYTHQWRRRVAAGLKGLCMASADTAQDVTAATARGWRSFRVRKHTAPVLASEAICPASREGGQRTQCDSCGLCAGATIKARNIVIADHGLMDARRAERRAA